jgi:hypothetical protein
MYDMPIVRAVHSHLKVAAAITPQTPSQTSITPMLLRFVAKVPHPIIRSRSTLAGGTLGKILRINLTDSENAWGGIKAGKKNRIARSMPTTSAVFSLFIKPEIMEPRAIKAKIPRRIIAIKEIAEPFISTPNPIVIPSVMTV